MERPGYSTKVEDDYLARGYWRDDDTLWHWLSRHAAERPGAPAVVSPAGQLTWRALHDRALHVAQGLHDKGIVAGDVVAVQLPNVPEFLLVHLALARLGALMCTVHMPYRGAEIEAILAHSGARLFFTGAYPFTALQAAAPLPAGHPAPDARYAVTQLWGMTELQAGLYTRPGDPSELSAASAGRPSPGTELRVADDGELQVLGPLAFSGYYGNDDATRAAFTDDGWFRTGDLAAERNGCFSITGRSRDIINRGGVKFDPADVEALLDAHPQIQQAAMVPMPDAVLGEKACAFVTLR